MGSHRTSSDEENDILTFFVLRESLGCVVGGGLALPNGSKRRRNSSAICEMAENGNSSALRQRMEAVNASTLGWPSVWGNVCVESAAYLSSRSREMGDSWCRVAMAVLGQKMSHGAVQVGRR